MNNTPPQRHSLFTRLTACLLIGVFTLSIVSPPTVSAQMFSNMPGLPLPGSMINLSAGYQPALLQGIIVHPEDPFQLDFIVDKGDSGLQGKELEDEISRLVKYFLAALTTPEEEIWVNLSPYEKNRIVPEAFGVTEMGRDLLAQDYLLKQLTASLMYPDDKTGDVFWKNVYQKAQDQFGTTQLPFNTFNKVWILPKSAYVFEQENKALLLDSKLKVMLEQDFAALEENRGDPRFAMVGQSDEKTKVVNTMTSDVVRELLIPEIEREVNAGKNFANLRQIYSALVLAHWYKQRLRNNIFSRLYVDQNKVEGVDVEDKEVKEKIYQQYLEAFKKGVYNYIKEEVDPVSQEMIPRKYYSGGFGTGINTATGAEGLSAAVQTGSSPLAVPSEYQPKLNPVSASAVVASVKIAAIPESSSSPMTPENQSALAKAVREEATSASSPVDESKSSTSSPIVPENLEVLSTGEKIAAIEDLVEIEDRSRLDELVKLAQNPSSEIQAALVRAFEYFKGSESIQGLIEILTGAQTDPRVRVLAVRGLGNIATRNSEAEISLIETLQNESWNETRWAIIVALGKIGGYRSIKELEAITDSDQDSDNRAQAVKSLELIQNRLKSASSPISDVKIVLKSELSPEQQNDLDSEERIGYVGDLVAVLNDKIIGGMKYVIVHSAEHDLHVKAGDIWVTDQKYRSDLLRQFWRKMKTDVDRMKIERIDVSNVSRKNGSYRSWKELLESLRKTEIKSYVENTEGENIRITIYPSKFDNGEEEPFASSPVNDIQVRRPEDLSSALLNKLKEKRDNFEILFESVSSVLIQGENIVGAASMSIDKSADSIKLNGVWAQNKENRLQIFGLIWDSLKSEARRNNLKRIDILNLKPEDKELWERLIWTEFLGGAFGMYYWNASTTEGWYDLSLTLASEINRDDSQGSSPLTDKDSGANSLSQNPDIVAKPPGGIDFNPRWIDMQIQRDGNGMPLPIESQPIEQLLIQIKGVVPVIINIAPVTSLPMLLGIAVPDFPEHHSDTDLSQDLRARDPQDFLAVR